MPIIIILFLLCSPQLFSDPGLDSSRQCWTVGRLKYGGGGDWYASPSGIRNLLLRATKDLGAPLCSEEKEVALLDADLYGIPILYMTGHGNVSFSEEERQILRQYLFRGGLLLADDNYGMDASFRREMEALFPHRPLHRLSSSHPVFQSHYRIVGGLPKIHKHDGKPAQAWGIEMEGRTVVLYSHESDLTNGWEDPQVHNDPPGVREQALRMGVNILAWFLQGQRSDPRDHNL